MKNKFTLLPALLLSFIFASCTRTANKTGPLTPYPEVTADINIGEQVREKEPELSYLALSAGEILGGLLLRLVLRNMPWVEK